MNHQHNEKYSINFLTNHKDLYHGIPLFQTDQDKKAYFAEGDFQIADVYLESTPRREGKEKREFIFPGNFSSISVKQKALLQNYFSRKLLYYPHQLIQEQILVLAKKLIPIITAIEGNAQREAMIQQLLFITQTTNTYLFNQQTFNEMKEYIKVISNKQVAMIDYKDIITITSTFCGINDIFTTPRTEDKELINSLKKIIKEKINNFVYPSMNNSENYQVLNKFNYKKTGLLRDKQKIREFSDKSVNGLFGYGALIDKYFFPNINPKLKSLKFEYCYYDVKKLENITEPLACGPSGSLASTMFMWNNFLGVDTNKLLSNQVSENDIKTNKYYHKSYVEARISAIIAVYISVGFHSAAELIETYYSLIGLDLRQNKQHRFFIPFKFTDFSDFRKFDATEKIILLLNAYTKAYEEPKIFNDLFKKIFGSISLQELEHKYLK